MKLRTYYLLSWNTMADGTGTHYDADYLFDITTDLELYAEWTCYTVTFVDDDEDSTVLDTSIWAPGETPVYGQAEPTKAPDAQYTYTFSGWSPSITAVDRDQEYVAQFNSTTNQYTATISVSPSGYGTVSPTSVTKDYNSTITTNGNKVTI